MRSPWAVVFSHKAKTSLPPADWPAFAGADGGAAAACAASFFFCLFESGLASSTFVSLCYEPDL